MEFSEELVHNVPAVAQNTIMSVAKKVKDNVLCMMTALVIAQHLATLQNPVVNPQFALLKVPNTLVIE